MSKTSATASTGHEMIIDLENGWLSLVGDTTTMDRIPESEIDALCASAGVRCTYDAIDETTYRVVTLHEMAVKLATASGIVDGTGALYTVCEQAIRDGEGTPERVREIWEQATADAKGTA